MKKRGILFAAGAVSILALARIFFFIPITVNGQSMEPALEDNEKVIGMKVGSIERFDIITFYPPGEDEESYIKRVIGLPGETVRYKNDRLYIDGKEYTESYLDMLKSSLGSDELLTEDMVAHVPKDCYFVMGDNRNDSYDSRHIGTINKKSIISNAKVAFWPVNKIGLVD